MTNTELIKQATEEAYYEIAEEIVAGAESQIREIMEGHEFIDFSEEVRKFIINESLHNNEHIVSDIVKPAKDEILTKLRKTLFYDNF